MLSTEKAIHKYYNETIDNWREPRTVEVFGTPEKLSENIFNTLRDNLSYNLTSLSNIWKEAPTEDIAQNLTGGINNLTKILYERNQSFNEIYKTLCKEILDMFHGEMVVQRQPTIRIHSSSLKDTFYPQWHSDLLLGHPVGTINIWIPFTQPDVNENHGFSLCDPKISSNFYHQSTTLYDPYSLIENKSFTKSKDLSLKAKPVSINVGEAVIFDSRCFHSAIPIYNHSRVSMDLRIIDKKYLRSPYPDFRGRGRRKAIFDINNFYMEI